MAQTIQIKRSSSTATPTSLSAGELAYSDSSDKLFIGQPSNNTVVPIGGKYYTDILDGLGAGTGLSFSNNTFSANVDGTNSEAPQNSTNTTGRTYKVQVDGSDNLVVNVPWSGGSLSATLAVGNTTGGSNIVFGDSSGTTDDRLVFGAGDDLQIYHNGSNSVIEDAGTGNLKLICQDLEVVDQSANKLFSSNSSAETIFFAAGSDDALKVKNAAVEVIARPLKVNDIEEYTSGHGVEIDSVTIKDGGITLNAGTAVNEFSTDTSLGGNSDDAVPTEKAVKTYVTNATSSFVTSSGVTSISSNTTDQIAVTDGSTATPEIGAVTATVTDGETALATGDQIHAFVTGQGYVTSSGVTSVGATAPVTSSGGTTPTIGVTTAAVTNGSASLATGDQIHDFVDTTLANFSFSNDTMSTSGSTMTIDPASAGSSGTVVIEGDLRVKGTTTTVDSNTVTLGDNILLLNSDETGTPSADAGLEVERGTSTNAYLVWDESTDRWSVGTALNALSPLNVENVAIDGGTF